MDAAHLSLQIFTKAQKENCIIFRKWISVLVSLSAPTVRNRTDKGASTKKRKLMCWDFWVDRSNNGINTTVTSNPGGYARLGGRRPAHHTLSHPLIFFLSSLSCLSSPALTHSSCQHCTLLLSLPSNFSPFLLYLALTHPMPLLCLPLRCACCCGGHDYGA